MSSTRNIKDLATELVDEMDECGHHDIRVIDLLDCLASTGLTLVDDPSGNAAAAYGDMIAERVRSQR